MMGLSLYVNVCLTTPWLIQVVLSIETGAFSVQACRLPTELCPQPAVLFVVVLGQLCYVG